MKSCSKLPLIFKENFFLISPWNYAGLFSVQKKRKKKYTQNSKHINASANKRFKHIFLLFHEK